MRTTGRFSAIFYCGKQGWPFLLGLLLLLLGACVSNDYLPAPEPTLRQKVTDFSKWERVCALERANPTFLPGGIIDAGPRTSEEWQGLTAMLADHADLDRVDAVNRFFNKWPYRRDNWVYGEEEYWATPREFLEKSGDCEDYAITKYYALRSLGYPAEQLRLAGIWNSRRNEGHCVLLYLDQGEALVLDNFSNNIVPLHEITHYIPQYYVNEDHLWLHDRR